MNNVKLAESLYTELLQRYIDSNDSSVGDAEEMSKYFVRQNIYPEEIIRIHIQAIEHIFDEEMSDTFRSAFEFLLHSLTNYRKIHQYYERIEKEQLALKSEIEVAADMQHTLFTSEVPDYPHLEIGAITVPYLQMNGDYYRFVERDDGVLGVAIADIIGKGVPAALSMSMVKYAMDSFHMEDLQPRNILRNLNRVVEKNIASHMFITMFYGQYKSETSTFTYSSAGHEPGFFYHAQTDQFREIEAKGIVLGVMKDIEYEQYEKKIQAGDKIILLTDGVTECKRNDRFIKREEVIDVIKCYNHLHAQEQVNKVYQHFEHLPDFELKDDFTLIIIEKK